MTTATAASPTARDPATLPLKLLRTALDVAAGDGEAETAAVKFVRAARRQSVTFDVLAAAVVVEHAPAAARQRRPAPAAWFVTIPFGRWNGSTLGHVALADLQYVRWVAEEARNPDLRDAAAAVLAFVAEGGGRG